MADEDLKMKRADLDQLSTEALKELVRADLASDDTEEDDMLRALERIARQEGAGSGADVDAAWETFRRVYCTEEGAGQSLYDSAECGGAVSAGAARESGRKPRRTVRFVLKRAGLVAAVLVLLLAAMVTVQAAGVNIFGAMAEWTDDVFRFESSGTGKDQEWSRELYDCILDFSLMPSWIPDGFETTQVGINDLMIMKEVWAAFDDGERSFKVDIIIYTSAEYIPVVGSFQKDSTPVEQYDSNGRTVYLFSNYDSSIAACLDGLTEISITGDLTRDEFKRMFDSIKGAAAGTSVASAGDNDSAGGETPAEPAARPVTEAGFSLNGEDYPVRPILQDLLDRGWYLLEANSYTGTYTEEKGTADLLATGYRLKSGESEIQAYLDENDCKNGLEPGECALKGLSVYGENVDSFCLDGKELSGIDCGGIVDALGEPDRVEEEEHGAFYHYYLPEKGIEDIMFSFPYSGTVGQIMITFDLYEFDADAFASWDGADIDGFEISDFYRRK